MLVLHAWWAASGGLHGWAEDSTTPVRPAPRPGRRPRVQDHPFAAAADRLTAVLGAAGEVATHELLLPTLGSVPVASPELLREVPPAAGTPTPGRWRVPARALDAAEAFAALRADLPEDAVPGATWRVLHEVAVFADDLAARGRVLPGLRPGPRDPGTGGARAVACWRPFVTGADAAWARALALAVPPAALAAATTPGPEDLPRPADVVASALEGFVDAAVRARLAAGRGGGIRPGGRAAVRSWVGALAGADPAFEAGPAELETLAADVEAWQRDAAGGAVRARFRLAEPPEVAAPLVVVPGRVGPAPAPAPEQEGWDLRFALQAVEEPSLVVDARDVWSGGPGAGALARHVPAPREALLTELGRATRLVPELADALRTARPDGMALDTEAAHAFLRQSAPVLAAAGFGVDLPGWWGRPGARLGLRLSAGSPGQPGAVDGGAGIGRQALVDFRWDLALGDDALTEEELAALARAQTPLVRLRGRWVELDRRRLERGLALLRARPAGVLSVAEVLGLLGSIEEDLEGLPLVAVEAHGWLGDLLSGAAEQRLEEAAEPAGFRGSLRPYQRRGLAWLTFLDRLGLGGVLADDMGLGKTVQLLALVAGDQGEELHAGSRDGERAPTLLVCPMSLVGNWQREAARFTPSLRVHVHHGSDRARGEAFEAAVRDADLVLTTYAVAARDAADLREVAWRRVVLDEAQAVKNAATRQALAVRSLPAAHRIAVTGTPVENRLADLWSILDFANPGLLGGASAFRQRYAVPIERHGDEVAAARLRRITQPFVLRRLKTDRSIIADLPDKLEMEVVCSLTREQATLYQAVVDDMLAQVEDSEGMQRRGLVLATMTKLKQVCNHPAQLLRDGTRLAGRSGKLDRIEATLEEVLAAGEKALLFTQFAEFGAMLRSHLAARFGREVLFLHGGVAKAERDAMVARFQDHPSTGPGSPSLFVLSLKAGGTGLTLTAANHVLHVDRWWNPAVEDQATDRAFRIGQTRAVQVRKLVCAGTVEERVAAMIRDKRGLAARIVGSGEGWLTELSTDQLRELVALDAGAVVE